MPDREVDVVVIGGGATGAGVLRDLAMRGLRSLLVERADFATGTSGRYHGLLHSGARYVVKDPQSADDCIAENAVLRRIAPHCLELTGGYFVATPDDPDDYVDAFPLACAAHGIESREVPLDRLFRAEPLLNRDIRRAFAVPDASLEPWELVDANLASAREHGSDAWPYHAVVGFERTAHGAIAAVSVEDRRTSEVSRIACRAAVSCAGAWAGQVAALAGVDLPMAPGKGSMLVFNRRVTNAVINRCAIPGDGDIIVPVGTVSILGTTDIQVADPDDARVTGDEVSALLADGERLVPGLSRARVMRAFAGVRPLYDEDALAGATDGEAHESRDISRAHHVIDHGARDGVPGLWSVVGGKLTTYRLMAEHAADRVCATLGVRTRCRTAREELPGAHAGRSYWLGERLAAHESEGGGDAELVCECELVTRARLTAALDARPDASIDDLRRATRLGMGPCQGAFCTPRAAAAIAERREMAGTALASAPEPNDALAGFLAERIRGVLPIAWGEQLQEVWLAAGMYRGTLAIESLGVERGVTRRLGEPVGSGGVPRAALDGGRTDADV
jgi:glycerol-3-phosphate dehydrogenase